MCLNPTINNDGIPIWCRKCKRCKQNRISDWVGRCIAESRFATSTHSVTLTYGRDKNGNKDHMHSALLIYRDVQNYFKRMRKAGYKFKYLIVGEYGGKRRRSHWHLIIFWDGDHPKIELNQESYWGHSYWEWGTSFWDEMTPASVWYVCKYIQKEQSDDEAEALLRMSKKPPIGHEYFQKWALDHLDKGLVPRSLHYSFDDVKHKDGKAKQFYMRGVTAENFLKTYVVASAKKYNRIQIPTNDFLQEWIDGKYEQYYENEKWMREQNYGKAVVEAIKKEELEIQAKPHGGIKAYYEGSTPFVEPLAVCDDDTFLHYGDPSADPIENFIHIIQS